VVAPSIATDKLLRRIWHEGSDVVSPCGYIVKSGSANPASQSVPPLDVDGSMRSEDNPLGRGGPEDLGSKRSILNSGFLNGGSWTTNKFCHPLSSIYILSLNPETKDPLKLIRVIIKIISTSDRSSNDRKYLICQDNSYKIIIFDWSSPREPSEPCSIELGIQCRWGKDIMYSFRSMLFFRLSIIECSSFSLN